MVCPANPDKRDLILKKTNMNKKILTAMVAAAAALVCACEQIDIKTYDDLTQNRYLYFYQNKTENILDTNYVSFMLFGGAKEVDYPVIVKSSGFSETAQSYRINVVKDATTATESEFELPASFEFAPKAIQDTFFLKLKYTDKLETDTLCISLDIAENEIFKLGPSNSIHRVIYLHNALVQPSWWTSTVSSYYLGTYSTLKYKYLLQVIGKDLDGCTNAEIRHYALVFKQWLAEQKAAGNPIKEANGTEMTVAVGQ